MPTLTAFVDFRKAYGTWCNICMYQSWSAIATAWRLTDQLTTQCDMSHEILGVSNFKTIEGLDFIFINFGSLWILIRIIDSLHIVIFYKYFVYWWYVVGWYNGKSGFDPLVAVQHQYFLLLYFLLFSLSSLFFFSYCEL